MRLRSLHRAYPSLRPSGVVHWVPEQLNIKAVTGTCKLIDGCSLVLCSTTPSVVSYRLAYATEMKSIQLHDYRDGPSHKIHNITSIMRHYRLVWVGGRLDGWVVSR